MFLHRIFLFVLLLFLFFFSPSGRDVSPPGHAIIAGEGRLRGRIRGECKLITVGLIGEVGRGLEARGGNDGSRNLIEDSVIYEFSAM